MSDLCRIGCGSGFWGDSPEGATQLLSAGCDFLIFDYLAEITMALLAANRRRNPDAGYVQDFIDYVFAPHARAITQSGVRIVANAGGVNVAACVAAVQRSLASAGVSLKIATVSGDDLLPDAALLVERGIPLPPDLVSLNAYLGAREIAFALDEGADVVITGRCADSALALGPLVHRFGWSWGDYDRLSQGSLAGHLLECGTQVTGGILTDWERSPHWENMGYPIAECSADGTFVIGKPPATGGLLSRETVCEQLVYEVGDPAHYLLPDVTCDWRNVEIHQAGADRVRVSGACGSAPPRHLKASAVYRDGFKIAGEITIVGGSAAAKAQKTADAILARTRSLMARQSFADYDETSVEILGAECMFGSQARTATTREVVLKIAARHIEARALEVFAREFLSSATSMAQGITGFAAGRPKPKPVLRHLGVLMPRDLVAPTIDIAGQEFKLPTTESPSAPASPVPQQFFEPAPEACRIESTVPLIALAYGRSGDKGDTANIGVIARDAEYMPYLRAALTSEAVQAWFAHLVEGPVTRFEWPALPGFNFVMQCALGGGGSASLRKDPQGKTYAQILMDLPIAVPPIVAKALVRL